MLSVTSGLRDRWQSGGKKEEESVLVKGEKDTSGPRNPYLRVRVEDGTKEACPVRGRLKFLQKGIEFSPCSP